MKEHKFKDLPRHGLFIDFFNINAGDSVLIKQSDIETNLFWLELLKLSILRKAIQINCDINVIEIISDDLNEETMWKITFLLKN